MKTKSPQEQINAYLEEAQIALSKAEQLADMYNISFDFSVHFGMGGTYKPAKPSYDKATLLTMIEDGSFANLDYETKQAALSVLSGEEESTDWSSSTESGWISSSDNC